MFRQLLEEAFEEFKQTVAPARPEISAPRPPGSFRVLPDPHEAREMMPRTETTPAPRVSARPPARPMRPAPGAGLRSQLSSPGTFRSAFLTMEVLGPPVALRDPLDRVQDR
jgi:hypothetical protein